jgi:hypothetical protein
MDPDLHLQPLRQLLHHRLNANNPLLNIMWIPRHRLGTVTSKPVRLYQLVETLSPVVVRSHTALHSFSSAPETSLPAVTNALLQAAISIAAPASTPAMTNSAKSTMDLTDTSQRILSRSIISRASE